MPTVVCAARTAGALAAITNHPDITAELLQLLSTLGDEINYPRPDDDSRRVVPRWDRAHPYAHRAGQRLLAAGAHEGAGELQRARGAEDRRNIKSDSPDHF